MKGITEMKSTLSLVVLVFSAISLLFAPRTLENEVAKPFPAPTNWTATEVVAAPILGNIACGSDSSVYFRVQQANHNPLEAPITRLSPDGSAKTIDLRNGTGFAGHFYVFAFNVDTDGVIYAVAKQDADSHWYLVSFDKNGQYTGKVPLQESVRASFLLPMKKTRFLISGIEPDSKQGSSVTSIFNELGESVKSIKLTDDDAAATPMPEAGTFNPSIQLGAAEVGPDGYTYILKASGYPKAQVIDSDGNTIRFLTLTPPAESARAYGFHVLGGGSIAVEYQTDPAQPNAAERYVELYNAATGKPSVTYLAGGIGIVACSSGNSLLLMKPTGDHHFALGRAPL